VHEVAEPDGEFQPDFHLGLGPRGERGRDTAARLWFVTAANWQLHVGPLRDQRKRDNHRPVEKAATSAAAPRTAHPNISRLAEGTFMPRLATLQRIAAILDEEFLVCFQCTAGAQVEREFASLGSAARQNGLVIDQLAAEGCTRVAGWPREVEGRSGRPCGGRGGNRVAG
jgi:hypothetical protein